MSQSATSKTPPSKEYWPTLLLGIALAGFCGGIYATDCNLTRTSFNALLTGYVAGVIIVCLSLRRTSLVVAVIRTFIILVLGAAGAYALFFAAFARCFTF